MKHTAWAALVAVAALAGCAEEHQELRAWMDEQRAKTPTSIAPIQAPKKFEPFRYDSGGAVDPFAMARLALKAPQSVASGPKPDLSRRREALEGFPLDTVKMVGHVAIGGQSYALLQAGTAVYQARVGNFVGQNLGQITRVTETEVAVKEMLQDATGEWVPRDAALRLQESKQ